MARVRSRLRTSAPKTTKAKVETAAAPVAGRPSKGRVKTLVRGQGSGIITASVGDVFFHKSDVQGQYWDLDIGDAVLFDLLDDPISGPRAQRVRTARAAKSPKSGSSR